MGRCRECFLLFFSLSFFGFVLEPHPAVPGGYSWLILATIRDQSYGLGIIWDARD